MQLQRLRKTGPRRQIGHRMSRSRSGLGEASQLRVIRLLVGLDRGRSDGQCDSLPLRFWPKQVDDAFLRLRQEQVETVGATRYKAKGYFQNSPADPLMIEESLVYEVLFIPQSGEQRYTTFRRNMDQIAATLAEMFCQWSVLVIRDDGGRSEMEFIEP